MVGRKNEIKTLDEVMSRKEGQFVAVYGRRRIGKTYLIRRYFSHERLCQERSPKANSILAAFTPCSYPHSDSTPWRRMPVKIRLQAATYATNSSVRMSKRSHRDGV